MRQESSINLPSSGFTVRNCELLGTDKVHVQIMEHISCHTFLSTDGKGGGRREVGRGWGVDGLLALNGDYCYLQTEFRYQTFLFFSVEFLFLIDI